MKLLFDENLSERLARTVEVDFPGSAHVRSVGLATASDADIWDFARRNGFALVTLDADFQNMSALRGAPPKVVWIKTFDTSTRSLDDVLRRRLSDIKTFLSEEDMACLLINVRETPRRR